jgi:hypothetical protein
VGVAAISALVALPVPAAPAVLPLPLHVTRVFPLQQLIEFIADETKNLP